MLNKRIKKWAENLMESRAPDVIIGDPDDPYLLRWWVLPRNKWFNLYLHRVLRSDDDRALHDHPWVNLSYIVDGGYVERTPKGDMWRKAGAVKFRKPRALHRLILSNDWSLDYNGNEVLTPKEALTLFFTGPRVRTWGFQCPQGWVKWTDFTRKTPEGTYVAKGCGDMDPSLMHKTASRSRFWPREPDQLVKT